MADLHPAIIHDFPLEQFIEGMTPAEKQAFYKGFSKSFTTMISALNRQSGVFRFPQDQADFFGFLSDQMIDVLNENKGKEEVYG